MPRAADLLPPIGAYPSGPLAAITDVRGVRVGHFTLSSPLEGHTGATAVLPHGGNLYHSRVPAGVFVGNGFGKMTGLSQIRELGELETPILLTNTLNVPEAAAALIEHTLVQPDNATVVSVNPVIGETNDARLNPIRKRRLTVGQMLEAVRAAREGPVSEGCVGAGAGTIAFGWKAGIGSSSRVLPQAEGGYTLGCLVQSNFGGLLRILGLPVHRLLSQDRPKSREDAGRGSVIVVLATDAPLGPRSLERLAFRAMAGLAATGAGMANGSGDYALAFSTAPAARRPSPETRQPRPYAFAELLNPDLSPLFQAALEATEEAIYNSLFAATDAVIPPGLEGAGGVVRALPLAELEPHFAALRENRWGQPGGPG